MPGLDALSEHVEIDRTVHTRPSRRWRAGFAAVGVATVLLLGGTAHADPAALSPAQAAAFKDAVKAAESGRWDEAYRHASQSRDEAALTLLHWLELTDPQRQPSFAELTAFLAANPTWPRRGLLLRRTEDAIVLRGTDQQALNWLTENPPITAAGKARFADALFATGKADHGRLVLRDAWVNGDFSKDEETRFYTRYKGQLTAADHRARLDRLLWDGDTSDAQRMLLRVSGTDQLIGQTRLLLRQRSGNVDTAIAKIPAALRNEPGLLYERMRWRRARGDDEAALEILSQPPKDLVRPELWWREKEALVRRLLRTGHISRAYRLAEDHRLEEGAAFAEGEWLAGWIALRFLGDHKVALDHFTRLYKGVRYPVSLARAAYWAGRAGEAMNDTAVASSWYTIAASHPTTYYGQLATARLPGSPPLNFPAAPTIDAETQARFNKNDIARAIQYLAVAGREDTMRSLFPALGNIEESAGWRRLTADLARRTGRVDFALRVVKDAAQSGYVLLEEGYPILGKPSGSAGNSIEHPLVLSVVRQESLFQTSIVSSAGAVGLMQLMPATAKATAASLNIGYSPEKLSKDGEYNMRLGQAYLADMIREFGGSYVLAVAAYNAGPSRARQWVRENGHPRDPAVDAVDWIEMIPFTETRNYVQRVMENLQVYRVRLGETEVEENLAADLGR